MTADNIRTVLYGVVVGIFCTHTWGWLLGFLVALGIGQLIVAIADILSS